MLKKIHQSGKIQSVLLVESDEFLADIYAKNIEMEGFRVVKAVNGERALAQLKNKEIDLILLSATLPGMNGFEVLAELKNDKKTAFIPVILLSKLGAKEDVEKSRELGAEAYIIKSHFRPSEIVDKIKKILFKRIRIWYNVSNYEKQLSEGGEFMNRKGFTLIELLVVIAIIGLLSTLSVVALGSARQKSRDSKRLSDLKQVQTALELYYTDNNTYPTTTVTLGTTDAKCLGTNGFHATGGCSGTTYMGLVPTEPTPGGTGYTYTGASTTFSITATLESAVNDLRAGGIIATQNGIVNASST